MKFVYKPEGAEPRTWPMQLNKLMNPEAEAIEKHTGMTFGQFQEALENDSVLAIHGFLYVMLKREQPTLKWDEVQFCLDDVDLELDEQDKIESRDYLLAEAKTRELTNAEQAMLDAFITEIGMPQGLADADADAESAEPGAGAGEGKAKGAKLPD